MGRAAEKGPARRGGQAGAAGPTSVGPWGGAVFIPDPVPCQTTQLASLSEAGHQRLTPPPDHPLSF